MRPRRRRDAAPAGRSKKALLCLNHCQKYRLRVSKNGSTAYTIGHTVLLTPACQPTDRDGSRTEDNS